MLSENAVRASRQENLTRQFINISGSSLNPDMNFENCDQIHLLSYFNLRLLEKGSAEEKAPSNN